MRSIYLLLLICFLWLCYSPDVQGDKPHIEIAKQNIGIPSQDSIRVWLEFVGVYHDAPWCAAGLSAWLHQAEVKSPKVRSPLARHFLTRTPKSSHISAGRVMQGIEIAPEGSLVLLRRGNTIYGHIGITVEDWVGAQGWYISGNTSPPSSNGPEHTGGGVWIRSLRINPNSIFRVTDFIIVEYE